MLAANAGDDIGDDHAALGFLRRLPADRRERQVHRRGRQAAVGLAAEIDRDQLGRRR
jgi:hypothetical protein